VDNITHSFVGVAIAELAQPASATREQRRVLMAGAVIAANLPDIDLAYTWITPPPLGYLLHHRGYTHTVAGLLALAVALPLVMRLWPAVRALRSGALAWLWGTVTVNLLGHVALDALNSYGVHPFYPFNPRWYYGDAVFVFEPLVWLVLGLAAACNARARPVRTSIVGLLVVIFFAITAAGVIPPVALIANLAAGAAFLAAILHLRPRSRAAGALVATTVFVALMFGLSRVARVEANGAARTAGDRLDVIVSPDPGMPLCWSIIVVARGPSADTYDAERGTLSLAPAWFRPDRCASYRLVGDPLLRVGSTDKVAWRDDFHQSATTLRDFDRHDCRVHAWLQFGRAPIIRNNMILDLRFDTGLRGNFTAMPLGSGPFECPSNLTGWAAPRADLLGGPQ
jgi:inner membrane protein